MARLTFRWVWANGTAVVCPFFFFFSAQEASRGNISTRLSRYMSRRVLALPPAAVHPVLSPLAHGVLSSSPATLVSRGR